MKIRLASVLLGLALLLTGLAPTAQAAEADSAILFIGDGMGFVHVQLAREAQGGAPLAMERLPVSGLATTLNAEGAVTDSAAAATALATGYKTRNGMLGLAPDGRRLQSILKLAQSMYKSTGLAVTDALWGATPSGFAVHVDDRGKRGEIALQLSRSGVDIMLGFWRGWFLPEAEGGERADGRNLLAEMRKAGYELVSNRGELLDAGGRKLVGLFEDGPGAPSLADMTRAAIRRLSQNPNGFILVVEGARIDWESHDHNLEGMLRELAAFDEAVAAGTAEAAKLGRTLVVVTSDHETGGLRPDGTWTTTGHTGVPVPVYAAGPGAERFSGEMDNTDIPKRMAEAMGMGPFPAAPSPKGAGR